MIIILESPLSVRLNKKREFILNLNHYRNAHYQVLNKAKYKYKQLMRNEILSLGKQQFPLKIHYTLFPKSNRKTDIGNVCSIHQKFFEDALVEFGIIEDDNYLFIPETSYSFGSVNKGFPRVDISLDTA